MKRLPGLDTVRLYTALCVVFVHATGQTSLLFLSGWNAVTLFFVLSGYIISYRLLRERQETGTIDIRSFYIRRELRILPLYYLVLLLGAGVLPLFGAPSISGPAFAAALLLFPQIPHALSNLTALGTVGTLWSIGVEEGFYLCFPVLIRRFSFVRLCLVILFGSVALGMILESRVSVEVFYLVRFMRFECMAVGALFAWLVVTRSRWLFVISQPVFQIGALVIVFLVNVVQISSPLVDLALALLFAVLITNISSNPRAVFKLEYRWSQPLGNLTYGIYLWHYPLIWVLGHWLAGPPLFFVAVVVTLGVAALSYRFYEQPFLRLKSRYRRDLVTASP